MGVHTLLPTFSYHSVIPKNRLSAVLLLILILILLMSCAIHPRTETPVPSIKFAVAKGLGKTLLIMLPGSGDRAGSFVKTGFVDIADRQQFDVLAVDAHFGYYAKGILVERLREDIIIPARAQGYENIWLLGISMGGLGALLYVAEYPNEIDGVILLAPFLGSSRLVEDIKNAGGLGAWSGDSQGFKPYEVDVWRWLKKEIVGDGGTPVYIGFGQSDSMAPAYDLLVQALDPSHVYTSSGGHNWKTWEPLWARIAADLEVSRGN